ncbi:hypothetical protein PtrCC142_002837 [Pyrenophora tritici-repentis]|nr:hypothetical protein PtrCC142_002837 [Pyrenophora tritici-repentis]
MFVRVEDSLPADPSFPADLKKLGYFINKTGCIRRINAPEKQFVYHATNNERVNEVRREAMQTCQRKEAEKRLSYLGINCIHLPKFGMSKPNGPHVPILSPSPDVLKSRKRVIVIVNDTLQDLGILAYRQLQRELGINGGSVVNFVKEIIKRSAPNNSADKDADIFKDGFKLDDDSTTPGLVVLNMGQLLYSTKYDQAMTLRSWSAMPRKSVVHDMIPIDEEVNRVPGHRTPEEHLKTVFDQVICNPERVAADAEVYVIALENGTQRIVSLIGNNFEKYGSRITAMALVDSTVADAEIHNPHARAFLRQRTRQWKYNDLTFNPLHCTSLPDDYHQDTANSQPQDTTSCMRSAKHISWHEGIPTGAVAILTNTLHRLSIAITPASNPELTPPTDPDAPADWTDQGVVCPTFSGGANPVGECIFTNPTVQHAILSFFEEVAQDPENYRNPLSLKAFTEAPKPTPDNPMSFDPEQAPIDFTPPPDLLTPEQQALADARDTLLELSVELAACPTDISELASGRKALETKISELATHVEKLEMEALSCGGAVAGEAESKRESWKPRAEGPKVPFAGTMVDSELLKATGLMGGGAVEEVGVEKEMDEVDVEREMDEEFGVDEEEEGGKVSDDEKAFL